jgi:hypothetical protein
LIDRVLALAAKFKVTVLSFSTGTHGATVEVDVLPPREFANRLEALGKEVRKDIKLIARRPPLG